MTMPALALRPALRSLPPFDDEVGSRLRLVAPIEDVLPFEGDAILAAVNAGKSGALEAYFGRQKTSSAHLPNPTAWARQFLQATVEALSGLRSPAQIRAAATAEVYSWLRATARTQGPGRTSSPPVILSVHVCEPADGVAEVSAVVRRGRRCQAIAARLESIDGAWQCIELTIL